MGANHLCSLTSEAPEAEPRRLCSSLTSNFFISDLQFLEDGNSNKFSDVCENKPYRLTT